MKTNKKRIVLLVGSAPLLLAGVLFGRSIQDGPGTLGSLNVVSQPPPQEIRTNHTFDLLRRVTDVERVTGHKTDFTYDAAGNITATSSVGRSSGAMQGEIVEKGNLAGKFTFEGEEGEPITLRLEAIPRAAGVGKFAELKINGKTVVAAFPVELTDVLPRSGKFVVRVKKANKGQGGYWGQKNKEPYIGPYDLTLEAKAGTVASFVGQPDPDEAQATVLEADFLDGRRGR